MAKNIKKKYIYIYITELLFHTAETNITLQINYTSIKKNLIKEPKNMGLFNSKLHIHSRSSPSTDANDLSALGHVTLFICVLYQFPRGN